MKERRRIRVQGIVQGVGFRPFVYGLATRAGLLGQVLNDATGVTIEVEGETAVLDTFTISLQSEAPPLAVIEQVTTKKLPPSHNGHTLNGFTIASSQVAARRNTFISPDMATCDDCLRELFDPSDRRYRYPFTNCTNCGPRFTIIEDVPYDRPFTTMSAFQMCADCQAEYDDPHHRRFHAQPNGCPVCGPQLQLSVNSEQVTVNRANEDVIHQVQALLAQGLIVAIKGLGGYHLACDATNAAAVQRLRERKYRWHKPFALMAADLTAVHAVCQLHETEEKLLLDRKRPIVLLRRKERTAVAPAVAPNQKTLGLMLPYTPLHHLLLHDSPCSLLVMTSGNRSDEPIVYCDDEVAAQLGSIADAILSHNRDIHIRCDDSVARVVNLQLSHAQELDTGHGPLHTVHRRSRGYAPQPLAVGFAFRLPVLAVGAHLKNTFCLGKGHYAFFSHHIGDLDNLETVLSFREGIAHFKQLFDIAPQLVAHDLHPDYLSSQYALAQEGLTAVAIQHHHAHIASVMAEQQLTAPVIGVAFDGTGYGTDGTVWGGEFLIADLAGFERVAYLRQVPLPGGAQAVQQPWRITAAWLQQLNSEIMTSGQWQPPNEAVWRVLQQMIAREVNCPLTSSMGRLFDAVAALLGVRQEVHYEGQAAIELEAVADESVTEGYTFGWDWPQLDPLPLFAEIVADMRAGLPASVIAARFHNGVVELITAVCQRLRRERNLNRVALSGGVFQNVWLLTRTFASLQAEGFKVYTNEQVPVNDGGIALGQAAIANEIINSEESVCV